MAYLSTRIIASRLGPANPRAIAWKGAGISQVSSEGGQIAHPNFSLYHATNQIEPFASLGVIPKRRRKQRLK